MSWRCEKNTRCPLSLVAIFKKSFIVLFNATTESVNYSVFWKKRFCNLTYKKNFVKHIENLPQHLSEKFIGDNLSITDIALKIEIYRLSVSPRAFLKLSIIVIAVVQKGLSCPSLSEPNKRYVLTEIMQKIVMRSQG